MTLESGKPLAESLGELNYGLSYLDFYAAEALRPSSTGGGFIIPSPFPANPTSPSSSARAKLMAINEAVGPAFFITPWNFPLAMITRKVGPAIAAGCPSILKPSELTPLTAMALETCARVVGISEGIFKVLPSPGFLGPDIATLACQDPRIAKISFTGSTAVGKSLLSKSADGDIIKRLSLELGGNAPFIVFDDADLDIAVKSAINSKFRNAGQTCVCADRFIISDAIKGEFVDR